MDQQLKDFADIEEMIAQNRRANYHRALREYEQGRDAEVIMELRRQLRTSETRSDSMRRSVWIAATAACFAFWAAVYLWVTR